MAHKKSIRKFWCHTTQQIIMAKDCLSCDKKCDYDNTCPQGNLFNSCKEIKERLNR